MLLIALALAALVVAPAGHAQVYKCTVNGATVYQDAACGTARGKLSTAPVGPPAPVPSMPAPRSATANGPEFAPGTVIPPSVPSTAYAPIRSAPAVSAAPREQTPTIAKPPTRRTGTPQDELQRAIQEQRAMLAQRRSEMDAMSERWRSNPGAADIGGDMEALDRRWRPREEAMQLRIKALTDAVFGH